MALCNRGTTGEISTSQFLFWGPLHISVSNGDRRLKFVTLVFLQVLWIDIKICPHGFVWGDQQPLILFLDPFHISETDRARKLKFGTLVGIYKYYGTV